MAKTSSALKEVIQLYNCLDYTPFTVTHCCSAGNTCAGCAQSNQELENIRLYDIHKQKQSNSNHIIGVCISIYVIS